MSSENSMFLAFSLIFTHFEWSGLRACSWIWNRFFFFNIVLLWFFIKRMRNWGNRKNIQSVTCMQRIIYNRCQERENVEKAINKGNASPGIQLRITFGFMSKVWSINNLSSWANFVQATRGKTNRIFDYLTMQFKLEMAAKLSIYIEQNEQNAWFHLGR